MANASVATAASSSRIPDEAAQAFTAFVEHGHEDAQAPSSTSLVDVTLSSIFTDPWTSDQLGEKRKLVEAVRFLGPALTSDLEQTRLRAVVLLALLITTLATSDESTRTRLFDKQAITTLATFFASKIEDGNTVAANIAQAHNAATPAVPESAPTFRRRKFPVGTEMLVAALRALLTLSTMDGFASEAARVTAENLVQHASPRVHPQAIRFLAFNLMDSLLTRHRSTLKSLGPSFVKGYIELVEGEKDPRNLVYIFAMDRVLLIEWDDLDDEAIESFFDMTYCYFPITFRPPPDDPYGITTNALRLALRRVLTASPLLAPHALPLLIEKMQASGGNAKRDTLDTLADALPVFGRSAALAHARELWQGFRIEIMHATDEATAVCATRALDALLFVLFVGVEEPNDGLAAEIVADMLDELEEPSKQQAKPASTIMGAMIRATPGTAKLAIEAELDLLLSMYKQTDDASVRPSILDHINTLFKAVREAYTPEDQRESEKERALQAKDEGKYTFALPSSGGGTLSNGTDKLLGRSKVQSTVRNYVDDGRPMDKFRDALITTIAHGLRTTIARAAAVDAFVGLSHVGLLTDAELRHLCESVNALLIDPSAEAVRAQALEGLRDLSHRSIVEETTLPLLFNALPDRIAGQASEDANEAVKGTIRRALGALARLCDAPDFFELLVVRLSTKLDLLCAASTATLSSSHSEREANVGYARGLLSTLTFVLQVKVQRKDRDTARHAGLVPRLIGLIVDAVLATEVRPPGIARDRRVVQDASWLIMLLVQCLDVSKQRDVATMLYAVVFDGSLQQLARGSTVLARRLEASTGAITLHVLDSDDDRQRDLLHTFASAMVALRRSPDVTAPPGDIHACIADLIAWTVAANSRLQEQAGSWLLADWINKYAKEPVAEELQRTLDAFWATEVAKEGAADAMQIDGEDNARISRKRILQQKRAVRMWMVMTRGFLVKNSRQAEAMVVRVLRLFDGAPSIATTVLHEAAGGMGTLLEEDAVLCKENGAVIRLLYRQRFVTFVLPKLLAGHAATYRARDGDDADDAVRRTLHLIAICALLPFLPRATLLERLTELFPLLILALDVHGDGVVQASAAQVITLAAATGKRQRDQAIMDGRTATALGRTTAVSADAVLERNSLDLVVDHTNSILARLLSIVTHTSAAPPTKTAALRCLATLARAVPYTTLHPHRSTVLRTLAERGHGIDDARRDVRLEAVDCRDSWFRLKGEGEDDEDDGGQGQGQGQSSMLP